MGRNARGNYRDVLNRAAMYTPEDRAKDQARILDALDAVAEVQRQYADVIAIPEVISLHDVLDYRLDTLNGITHFYKLHDRKTAVHVLHVFATINYLKPEWFENVIVSTLAHLQEDQ